MTDTLPMPDREAKVKVRGGGKEERHRQQRKEGGVVTVRPLSTFGRLALKHSKTTHNTNPDFSDSLKACQRRRYRHFQENSGDRGKYGGTAHNRIYVYVDN